MPSMNAMTKVGMTQATVALTSCTESPTVTDDEFGRRLGAEAIPAMIAAMEAREPQAMTNVCQFYYRLHGQWPHSAAELAGTPLADGAPFDPKAYLPMNFNPQPDGSLKVSYTSRQIPLPIPNANANPGTATIEVKRPKPIAPVALPLNPGG